MYRFPIPPVPAIGAGVCIELSPEWVSHVMGAVASLLNPNHWAGDENEIFAAQQQVHQILSELAYGECMQWAIGDIKQSVQYGDHDGWLKCDGRQLSIATYPGLATAMGAGGWTTDEEFFNLPNFVGRVPVGAGTSPQSPAQPRAQGVYLGADTHTLTIGQIPLHTHAIRNRTGGTAGATEIVVAGRAVIAETPTTITTTAAGNGEAHNNMQSSLTVNFFIFAGE